MTTVNSKMIGDNEVRDQDIRLDNNDYLRARNAANSADVNILRVNASDRVEFASVPQASGTPSTGNDLVNKTYADALGGSGAIAQVVYVETATSTTYGSALIPIDDTLPQNTEGAEALTATITPTSASSQLFVECVAVVGEDSNTADAVVAALFRDSGADAIAVDYFYADVGAASPHGSSQTLFSLRPSCSVSAGSTSATTFKLRVGLNGSTTVRVNGVAGTRFFGGAYKTYIRITEVLP